MEYNSGSNRAIDLKLRARLPLNCTMQSPIIYQYIVLITKCEKLLKSTVEKRQSKSQENIPE